MKRLHKTLIIIGIILLALFLMSSKASAPAPPDVAVTSVYRNGMEYGVFKWIVGGRPAMEVVNFTKDKLEVEKLKAEIEYYKKLN